MNVPTIIEDDLRDFHSKHFPSAPLPEAFFHSNQIIEPFDLDDDDGLGYYPDGMKRTLTDEQIAIFRHSEIRAILKGNQQGSTPSTYSPVPNDADATSIISKMGKDGKQSNGSSKKKPCKRAKKNKRKWEPEMTWETSKRSRANLWKGSGDEWTPRREARELDENKDVAVDLEY
ncbi:hypothetical protein K432DRAFT_401690 [Lepidopterella palustris CBS 459.81]|uniref:Uncharacterized protein n=1 Tax=Lepidopterella palustris CBS 459.81 TaxID=1314670 RepID=A0A8E2EHD9_9PEZI|nr:hypothetical protein K432DRAFT_401690 [Lepidopterella palustris CBS 459.81]